MMLGRIAVGQDADLTQLSLVEAAELVRSRRVSPVELTRACLDRIRRLQPILNAFITVTDEQALNDARKAEVEILQGHWRGPLHGIPVAVKDEFDTAGVRTTGGSRVFLDRVPDQDAEVVRRLKEAGAIFLGKLNMDEFGGGIGVFWTSHFGPVHNPWDVNRYAGAGSSTGSAAAIAAGLCYGALGADTGGSIRGPASWSGTVGLKPTFGRVSNRGAIPYSWSLDHVGPMTRTIADTAAMLQVIAGYDLADTNTVNVPVPDYAAALDQKTGSLRLGVPRVRFYERLDPEVEIAVNEALSVLRSLTAEFQDTDLQQFPISMFGPVSNAESWTYHEPYVREAPELYSQQALNNLRNRAATPLTDYIRGRRDLALVRRAVADVFSRVDLLVMPTVITPSLQIGDTAAGINLFRNTNLFNVFGLPAISVPCGFTTNGLPIGLQIIGPHWSEENVLRLAHAYEQATRWHLRRPNL
jgi:aspartyl-tRNA(Asn)/glutamyl-tRNA(Gln) amidotransferase subunit A